MRVCIYEHLTAQGLGRCATSPMHAMYREGRAMRDAVIADVRRVTGAEVVAFPDHELPIRRGDLRDAVRQCDWALLIAPETGGILASLAEDVVAAGGELLGPSPTAIRLTSDKLGLATYWRERGIPTPATTDRSPTPCEAFPVVWKPRDGAGSEKTFRLNTAIDVVRARALVGDEAICDGMILQEFVPGRAASMAFLCGPAGHIALPPTFQQLSADDRFRYQGGEIPLPSHASDRATRLGRRAIEYIGGLRGYVGVDLILGEQEDGSGDYAIEINPRLTTSYVGYRALAEFNVAERMIQIASGCPVREMTWKKGRIRFAADGVVSSTY